MGTHSDESEMTTKILQSDATSPSIPLIRTVPPYTGEKLSRTKLNFIIWVDEVDIYLTMCGLQGYVHGTTPKPDSNEPRAQSNWTANDQLAAATILSTIEAVDRRNIDRSKGAKSCWDVIRRSHHYDGPIRQVDCLREALFNTVFTKETPLSTTRAKIDTAIDRAYAIGEINRDTMKCIAYLNALASFPHIRAIISRELSNSTRTSPLTASELDGYFDNEQSLIESDSRRINANDPIVLASHAKPPPTTICSNCKRSNHSTAYCIAPGGGMAGKTIEESKAARRRDKEAKKPKPNSNVNSTNLKPKIPIQLTGPGGKVYTLQIDSELLQASSPSNSTGATLTEVPSSTSLPSDKLEYSGWITLPEDAINLPLTDNTFLNTTLNHSSTDATFWMDTGATMHVTNDQHDFYTFESIAPRSVRGLGGVRVNAIGIGAISIQLENHKILQLENVLFIPDAGTKLMSIRCLTRDAQAVAHYDDTSCWITAKSSGTLIAKGTLDPSTLLYRLHTTMSPAIYSVHHLPNLTTWHRRLGHANMQAITIMARNGTLTGAPIQTTQIPPKCDSCILGKQTRTPVPKIREQGPGHKSTQKLEKVWVDLNGPHAVESRTGNKYIMNIVDDYSHFTWSIPLKTKDQAFPELKAWQLTRETETSLKVMTFRTDGGELSSRDMDVWLKSRGTQHQLTAPYTSAHIGRVERVHRTLGSKSRTMRIYANLPIFLWDELYLTACHLHNKTTSRTLEGKTAWERWYGRSPDYSYMREIGCKAFVLIQNHHNPKLFDRSEECVLIGYDANSKSYRCYHRPTKRVISSYHVRFLESQDGHLPATGIIPQEVPISQPTPSIYLPPYLHDEDDDCPPILPQPSAEHSMPSTSDGISDTTTTETLRRSNRIPTAQRDGPSRLEKAIQDSKDSATRRRQAKTNRSQPQPSAGEGDTDQTADIVASQASHTNGNSDYDTSAIDISGIWTILEMLIDTEHDVLTEDDVPRTWNEAKTTPDAGKWTAGYLDELRSLKEMGVYELIPRSEVPPGQKIRQNKPVFTIKRDQSGCPVRWKVRVTFKGCHQVYGRDYTKSTSPTARMESWRILLHIAASLDWDAQQIDVKTAFLNGILPKDEIQYMEQPPDFEERSDHVWKIIRSLYGMRQSGRIWNQTMNRQMILWKFRQLLCEPCIYIRQSGSDTIIVAVHVDDFLAIANTKQGTDRFKQDMRQVWKITDLGMPTLLVGITIQWLREEHLVALSQVSLIDRIVTKFGQSDADPLTIPMEPGLKLLRTDMAALSPEERHTLSKLPYRSLVGSLLYLAIGTRPDISYSVQQLSQFLDSYSTPHWQAAIRVVRYLKGTRDLKLYLGGNNFNLIGFTDSDWANCPNTRRSVGGYAFSMGSGVVSWQSRKQKTVAASSCEAEYIAAFEAAKEATWLRTLLQDLNIKLSGSTTIQCDNNAAITLSGDPSFHDRVKHIDTKYHFLRERVQSGDLQLSHIPTKDNIADIFTKALEKNRFTTLRSYLGLR